MHRWIAVYGQEYDLMPEGLLLEEDEGVLGTDAGLHQRDYHILDWENAPQQPQPQRKKGTQQDPQTTSGDNTDCCLLYAS